MGEDAPSAAGRAETPYQGAIIGAGPLGIECHAALREAGLDSIIHYDAGPIGSTMQWWAPETRFFSSPERIEIAGVAMPSTDQAKATREQYLAYLRAVVQQFRLPIETYRRVVDLRAVDDHRLAIETARSAHGVGGPDELADLERRGVGDRRSDDHDGDHGAHRDRDRDHAPFGGRTTATVHARNIILAIGDMHRPRMLGVPGENRPHVSHYLGEIHQYFGRRVLIVGGKNSAVEAAIRLYRAGARVALSYRGEEFDPKRVKYWLRPELEWLIKKNRIAFHPKTIVESIGEETVALRSLEDPGDARENRRSVPADFVLLLTGYVQDTSLFEMLGVKLTGEERAPTFDRATMRTNVPGVYVAGTAAGGTQQRARLFIENTHIHVHRIVRALTGREAGWKTDPDFSTLEES